MSKSAATRFNPPPNWKVRKDFAPPPGWQPDPAWGPPPQGWPMYVTEARKTHRFRNFIVLPAAGIIALVVILSASISSGSKTSPPSPLATDGSEPTTSAAALAQAPVTASAPAQAAHADAATVSQQQAIQSAQSYLSLGSGFSRAGLIQQLTSKEGEGFSMADALYAIDSLKVDWNEQAVESAKGYLQIGGFSRAGLIEQLSSAAGEGFTVAQATYAVDQVGLQ